MMISTGLPELSTEKDLNYLRETLVSVGGEVVVACCRSVEHD